MSLNLYQVGAQISNLQNQNQATTTNSILSLDDAALAPPKYEHIFSPLHHHSSYGVLQSPDSMPNSSAGFFLTDPNQGFQDFQSYEQGTISSNKQLYGLMQLPDFQGNTNNNSFFTNSNNGSGSIVADQFNNINNVEGNQGTRLYTNNNSPPHISATALLQKAAQMSSTTIASSIGGAKSFGSDSRGEGIRSSMENDQHHHLHGLMNSIGNGNNSIYGNVKGNENNLGQFHKVEEPNKLSQNLGVCFGESDKLTLDFLGVGGMVTNMNNRF
ncbi:unnamed protein product [Lupinus luteus]|uniref:Uncharacterized protein n=1 Tax=Lupinus luteus TaxID=3873 RepID=A0AAV1WZR9_LUPLU